MKNFFAGVLAAVMVMGISSTAFAAKNSNPLPLTLSDTDSMFLLQFYDGKDVTANTGGYNWKAIGTTVSSNTTIDAAFKSYKTAYAKCKISQTTTSKNDLFNSFDKLRDVLGTNAPTILKKIGATSSTIPTAVTTWDKYVNPSTMEAALQKSYQDKQITWGKSGVYAPNKATADLNTNLYTYGDDNASKTSVEVIVKSGERVDAHVVNGEGLITVSKKVLARAQKSVAGAVYDSYQFTLKAKAGVRVFDLTDWTIEFDVGSSRSYFLKGKAAYSDQREVFDGDRFINIKSDSDNSGNDGCVYYFSSIIDDGQTRIRCNDYVDVFFKGNYGTDKENMRVVTDEIEEIRVLWKDADIDYYDFVGTPKFATSVTLRIDGDKNAFIYEYDKTAGTVTDITSQCTYSSDGWTCKRKTLKTYLITETAYKGTTVK